MKDEKKLGSLVVIAALLCALGIAYNVASEYVLMDIQDYFKRRVYYQTVISKKGLSMHRAMYWKALDNNKEEERGTEIPGR